MLIYINLDQGHVDRKLSHHIPSQHRQSLRMLASDAEILFKTHRPLHLEFKFDARRKRAEDRSYGTLSW